MSDLMLDIETLGVRPTSVITQIGACYFNRETGEIGDSFLRNINVGDSLLAGCTTDEQTINWWKSQPPKNLTWVGNTFALLPVLSAFSHFTKKVDYVWSHSTFDVPILCNAYQILGLKLPFHYRSTRDIRTLTHLAGHKKNEKETFNEESKDEKTHNALEDCVYQVQYCVECFNKIKTDKIDKKEGKR